MWPRGRLVIGKRGCPPVGQGVRPLARGAAFTRGVNAAHHGVGQHRLSKLLPGEAEHADK
jgi:hypothetical protein